MIKYVLKKWDENNNKLEEAICKELSHDDDYTLHSYKNLVKLICDNVLNVFNENEIKDEFLYEVNTKRITEIDDGNYQGTLIYLLPWKTYQNSCHEYFMTCVEYGSCSCCDTLQSIEFADDVEKQIKDYMTLCRDICSHIIVPYNYGWRHEDKFDFVEEDVNND